MRRAGIHRPASIVSLVFADHASHPEIEEDVMNEGTADRIIRVVVGIALLALGWGEIVTGTLGTVLKIVGFVPLATGLVGWCPLYAIGHLSTRSRADERTAAAR
jgi:hypothetical protein